MTHIISKSFDEKEIEFLTRKSYWFDNCQSFLINASLPKEDKAPAFGDTIKTDMLKKMEGFKSQGFLVKHVTVMPDATVYTFHSELISNYVVRYNAYLDHFYGGEKGAVFYPQRLASEFRNELDKWS